MGSTSESRLRTWRSLLRVNKHRSSLRTDPATSTKPGSSSPASSASPTAIRTVHSNSSAPATMDLATIVERLRRGAAADFPPEANTEEYAAMMDSQDVLKHLRDEFILPTRRDLRKRALEGSAAQGLAATTKSTTKHDASGDDKLGIYFVGNSLGAQPKAIREYISAHLETWGSLGVQGHFVNMANSPLVQWQDMAEDCANKSADLVGARPHEIVIMNTLTINLHLMMASFYTPDPTKRHKIILESRPFPSDHYAIESQVRWHGLDPETSMVKISPDEKTALISTDKILATIDEHADSAALLLLPGIQYYSGQLFDIPRITAYARQRGITVGWDLAHAAGNVELQLHDWDVDFACWCTYKYINAGPGSIAGAFVHERHGAVEWPSGDNGPATTTTSTTAAPVFRPRLAGWYGGDKSVRFNMDTTFVPTPGAAGYQASNPSAIDLACLSAALSVFGKTSMRDLRSKSLALTAYAQALLERILADDDSGPGLGPLFRIITPLDPAQRGSQLSILLRPGLLDKILVALEENGVMCDKRKPDVIRVAPVPLYSRFEDVWRFMQIFRGALGLRS